MDEHERTVHLATRLEMADATITNEPGSGVPVVDASGRVIGYATIGTAGHVTAEVDQDGLHRAGMLDLSSMELKL